MDDLVLSAEIDSETTLRVSPIAPETFSEYIEEDTVGGNAGYFVLLSRRGANQQTTEILAKAPDFNAAETLFDIITTARISQLSV
ncbi:MAG: hypothetical protein AAGB23_12860 [Pseudomonadota bacterium]